jgi:F-type H+-transporting ATPase subunit delta
MSTLGARRDEISKRYGGVLFELAQEEKVINITLKDAERLQKCFAGEPLEWRQVVGPTVPLKVQHNIIEKLSESLKLSPLMTRFLLILTQNRRLQSMQAILDEFHSRTQHAEGIVHGMLETATKLTKKDIESLQKSLGKGVLLEQRVNENILGGVILRMGSTMIDASLGTQLNKLRQVMKG